MDKYEKQRSDIYKERAVKSFEEVVGEAIGRASVAWSEVPHGEFDSTTCRVLCDSIVNYHQLLIEELEREIKELKSNSFIGDYQIFTHDLLFANDVGITFQGIRRLVYSYRLSEGHSPLWGDDSYKTELKSLKLEDLPNIFKAQ